MDFIEFINSKKQFIRELANDTKATLDIWKTSERLEAYLLRKSNNVFVMNAKKEQWIISKAIKADISDSLEPYVNHIFSKILFYKKENKKEESYFDRTCATWHCNLGGVGTLRKTVEFLILPEILTMFYMENMKTSYKDTIRYLYNGTTPTTQHIDVRLSVSLCCDFYTSFLVLFTLYLYYLNLALFLGRCLIKV